MKYAKNTLLIGAFLLTVLAVKLLRNFINPKPEGDWDWIGYFGFAFTLWFGLPLLVAWLILIIHDLWQSLRDGSLLRKITDPRFIVGILAVIGFFTLLAWIGEYMYKPVRWFIIDEYAASDSSSIDGAIVEGIVGGSLPWEKPPRFWLRLKNGVWESAWIADGRKIEWSEAQDWMLKNPNYSQPISDY